MTDVADLIVTGSTIRTADRTRPRAEAFAVRDGRILAIGDRCIMLDKEAQGMIAEGDPRRLKEDSTNPTVRAFFRREAA